MRHVGQRYGFVVVTWAVLIATVLVVFQLVRNPALLPRSSAAPTRPSEQPELAHLGLPSQRPPSGPQTASNLITNWSFEQDLRGWRRLGRVSLERATGGRTSGSAARVQVIGRGPATVGLEFPAAAGVGRGSRWVATVWVLSDPPGLTVELSVVAATSGRRDEVGSGHVATRPGGRWQRVVAKHRVERAGATLKVRLLVPRLEAGQAMFVDEVMLRPG